MNSYSALIWMVPMIDGTLRTYVDQQAAYAAAGQFKADGRARGYVYCQNVYCNLRSQPKYRA